MCSSFSQKDLSGRKQYPQFRTTSGLPGSGFTISPLGDPSFYGAIAISIPVAYSLANGVWVGGVSFAGRDMQLRFPRFDSSESDFIGNGTGWLMTGFGGKWGRLTASVMVLSSQFDAAFNALYTPPGQRGPVTFGVGVQDSLGDGGTSGQAIDEQGGGNSRSVFATSTWKVRDNVFATAGIGTNRFRFGFGGVSWNMDRSWSLEAEHDGYNFNGGVAYRMRLGNDAGSGFGSLMLGTIRGKYLFASLSFGF
ncbi:MAG: hypothetical protein H7Y17_08410 [Chlorobia bacterium]|nr:hypothetical protein [Fimbriimonadaceae bacterium]